MAKKANNKTKTNNKAWERIRRQVEAGMSLAQAARELDVSRSTVGRRAKKEGWVSPPKLAPEKKTGFPGKAKSQTARAAKSRGDDPAAALEACERAVTRALIRAAEGLMEAETDISKAMEPVDRALKLKRELAKENREQGNTTVVVETLVPPEMPTDD